jgi:hypothetical protein
MTRGTCFNILNSSSILIRQLVSIKMSQISTPATSAAKEAPKWKRGAQYIKPGEELAAGDSGLTLNILPEDLEAVAFENLKREVQWKTMYHHGGEVPRLVAVEGEIQEDGW